MPDVEKLEEEAEKKGLHGEKEKRYIGGVFNKIKQAHKKASPEKKKAAKERVKQMVEETGTKSLAYQKQRYRLQKESFKASIQHSIESAGKHLGKTNPEAQTYARAYARSLFGSGAFNPPKQTPKSISKTERDQIEKTLQTWYDRWQANLKEWKIGGWRTAIQEEGENISL